MNMSSLNLSSHDESTNDMETSIKELERSKASSPSSPSSLGNGLKMRIKRNGKMKPGSTSSSSSSANNSRAASPSSSTNSRTESDGKSDLVHDFILAATGARKDQDNPLKNLILKQQACLKENGGSSNGENSCEPSIFNGGEDERSNEASTMTEPDKLGPCEPGTAVRLQGIVWQETEKGLLVLNVTWKGKTYMGTLLDCNRQSEAHKWGPLSDPSAIKGRGSKRNRSARSRTPPVTGNGNSKLQKKNGKNVPPPPKTPEPNPVASIPSKVKRRAAINALCGLKKKDPDEEDDSVDEFDDDENDIRDCLIECPKGNCSKKFRDLEALKFHLSFAHNDLKRPKKPMESKVVPEEESPPCEEREPPQSIDGSDSKTSSTSVEMPEALALSKKLENSCQKVLPPMPLNTLVSLPQEARLTSSTGSSSNKDSCESNAYSDISDEEPDPPVSGILEKDNTPSAASTSSSLSQNSSQRTSLLLPNVPSLPTSSSSSNSIPGPPPNIGGGIDSKINSPLLLRPSTPHFAHSSSNHSPKGNSSLLVPAIPSTSPFASQAFRHFAMFGSSHSPGAKSPQALNESPLFGSNHHPRKMLPMDQKQQHSPSDILRSFPHHPFNPLNPVNSAPVDFSHGKSPSNQFLAASKLQELQEKAFSSLHPDISAPSPSSHFPLVDHSAKHHPGNLLAKTPPNKRGPLHNLFPRGPSLLHSPNNILHHEHKHTHLHLPGIAPLSNAKNESIDSNHFSGNKQ